MDSRRKRNRIGLAMAFLAMASSSCSSPGAGGGAPKAAPSGGPALEASRFGGTDVGGSRVMTGAPQTVAPTPTDAAGALGATAGGAKDIGWAREVIARGGIPDSEAITAEGLFSESDLPLEGEPARDLLSLNCGVATAEGAYLVQIGMSSNLDAATWKRPPLDVVAVVDVSGSMQESGKLEATKAALRALVGRLGPADRLGIVSFNARARVVAAPGQVAEVGKDGFLAAIEGLRADGSTNMHAGLELGYREVAETAGGGRGGRAARVILFTDALPNTGSFSDEGFVRLASKYGVEGIGLTAFGVGIDFGHDLARRIAECPGGNYKFLRAAEEVAAVFEEDFDYLVTPLAYHLDVRVTPAPGFEIAETYGFPGGGFHVATVFLSRNRGALAVRLRPTSDGAVADAEAVGHDEEADVALVRLCEVKLAYRTALDAEEKRETARVVAPRHEPAAGYFSHRGVRKTFALTMLAVAMRDACATRSASAVKRLDAARARLEREAEDLGDADLRREGALAARLLANLRAQASSVPR